MTRLNQAKSNWKSAGFAALTFALFTTNFAGSAAATPVADHVVRRNTAQISAKQNQNLREETQQTQILQDQLDAMGRSGSGMSIINSSSYSDIGSQSDFYSNMEKFGFDMCAINLCQVGNNPTTTTDIDEARDWAMKTFFASTPIDNDTAYDLQEVRRRAIAYTTANAFALSTTIHSELSAGGGTAQALEELVDAATDRRKDIQANSAIALAQYKVAIQQLAVLSALLDVQSARAIQDTGLYHEDGGTEFPDAYIRGDYRDDQTRQLVTIPRKGSPN